MNRSPWLIAYGLVMVSLIVAVDLLFLRDHPWTRLAVNVGIVAVFGGVYWHFLKDR